MAKIKISPRQFQHIALVNAQIKELEEKRKTFLELILDSSEVTGKNIKITKIDEDGIDYELEPDSPKGD